jgi:hypothetical protein
MTWLACAASFHNGSAQILGAGCCMRPLVPSAAARRFDEIIKDQFGFWLASAAAAAKCSARAPMPRCHLCDRNLCHQKTQILQKGKGQILLKCIN